MTRVWEKRSVVHLGRAAGMAVLWGVAACSPTFNWRTVRHEAVPLSVVLPCKPDQGQREMPLWGPGSDPVPLYMLSCDTGGATFVWAAFPLTDVAQAEPAMSLWMRATAVSMGHSGASLPSEWVREAPVSTQSRRLWRWMGQGKTPDGAAVSVRGSFQVDFPWLIQRAVYAQRMPASAVETFLDPAAVP